uniref:Uncharacterized protein n=1 Tax=Arundo donax TaxID=35708 RepID=A0A0A9FE07_ARUDO
MDQSLAEEDRYLLSVIFHYNAVGHLQLGIASCLYCYSEQHIAESAVTNL